MTSLPFHTPADAERASAAVRAHLANGGILAYPTETVYGFGTSLDAAAVATLALGKGGRTRPFLILAAEPRTLPGIEWTPAAELLADTFWPGALSLALAADAGYPAAIRGATGTVAVRDTPHAALRRLLQLLRHPLTSTSANLPGEPPATTLAQLFDTVARFPQAERVLVLDGGELPPSAPSSVVDCSVQPARLVREGAITLAQLRATLQPQGFDIDVA